VAKLKNVPDRIRLVVPVEAKEVDLGKKTQAWYENCDINYEIKFAWFMF